MNGTEAACRHDLPRPRSCVFLVVLMQRADNLAKFSDVHMASLEDFGAYVCRAVILLLRFMCCMLGHVLQCKIGRGLRRR